MQQPEGVTAQQRVCYHASMRVLAVLQVLAYVGTLNPVSCTSSTACEPQHDAGAHLSAAGAAVGGDGLELDIILAILAHPGGLVSVTHHQDVLAVGAEGVLVDGPTGLQVLD